MIEYQNVSKCYQNNKEQTTAVNNISLKIRKGELLVLLGPSGCGKTTLLRLTNRLEEISSGKIMINNNDIIEKNPVKLRQQIGYVIQEIGLFPNKNVAENIGIVPKVLGWSNEEIGARVRELLKMMELEPDSFIDRYPVKLSGGQRQRIGVARALAADPEFVLMDEPFGAIDPINRKAIQDQFLSLQQELKKTIIFVTHDIAEAVKMADRIAIMNKGEIIQVDTPENIIEEPANDFVKNFLGEERLIQGYRLGKYEFRKKEQE